MSVFQEIQHQADICVVGGGMAGVCAAISAARHGAAVVLMHDRPMFGGNASSECRVHVCGADRHGHIPNMRETGVLEEIRMENLYRNPNRNFSVWDTVLYDAIAREPGITSLMNCSCNGGDMDGSTIEAVTGWQTTSQTCHRVEAKVFIDCSGDSVLAPITGAENRVGRESRDEFGESIAPKVADDCTMGMTCLFQTREYETPQAYEPPSWAYRYESCNEMPYGAAGHRWWEMGYWWVELGGEHDSIHDTELLRDELLKTALGVWDHIKNRCSNRDAVENWALEWLQFLPAKRESRRYVGDHILTQNDILAGGSFKDIVAYGGWSMDDHHPAGFGSAKIGAPPTIFHEGPSPYGIPYRCLYSRNIDNLMFAGRNASCTHAAMSSTRVMGTGSSMGQAVGTAAAIAVDAGITPREVTERIDGLQHVLLHDDAYLPGLKRRFGNIVLESRLTSSTGDPEPVRDGVSRPVGDTKHGWLCTPGDWIAYTFHTETHVTSVSLVLESRLDLVVALSYHQKDRQLTAPPEGMPRAFRIEGLIEGSWAEIINVQDNYQRLYNTDLDVRVGGLRFVLEETWGKAASTLYTFDFAAKDTDTDVVAVAAADQRDNPE